MRVNLLGKKRKKDKNWTGPNRFVGPFGGLSQSTRLKLLSRWVPSSVLLSVLKSRRAAQKDQIRETKLHLSSPEQK